MYFRLVTRAEVEKSEDAKAILRGEHPGRFNTPDETMVLFVYKVRLNFELNR